MSEHQHGWDCFKTSGGYTNAMEVGTPLPERIETVYRTAYATGFKNGRRSLANHIEKLEAVAEAAGALFTLGGQMHPMTAEDGSTLAELVLPADYVALRVALAALGEGPTKA